MIIRDPEKLFDELWETFNNRYPFFKLRGVDWQAAVRQTPTTGHGWDQ